MTPRHPRLWFALLSALVFGGSSARTAPAAGRATDRLVVVSVSDLKAKTSPCGCSVPRGGFGRMATILDSLRSADAPVVFVDGGGCFPDVPGRPDLPPFVLASYSRMQLDAMAIGPRDLQFGLAFLRAVTRSAATPVTCANLFDRTTGRPAFPTSRMIERDGIKIGVFALYGDRLDLGPARDSLEVREAENVAHATVRELKARGAQVIVLLAQLGRVGGEDLATAGPGIALVVLGYEIPVYMDGRRVADTILSYGGDQGQHIGVATFGLGPDGGVRSRDALLHNLGPEVAMQAAMQGRVRDFEDAYNESMRIQQRREQALADGDPDQDPVDHFVGGEICARCHEAEAKQWATTAHSLAWETLVREKKDATPECVTCHSVGYTQPGGFRDAVSTPHLVNVQCENCHGMGTLHTPAWYAKNGGTEATCRSCHNAERDPGFNYAAKLPLILHSNSSGESIRLIQARRQKADPGMRGH